MMTQLLDVNKIFQLGTYVGYFTCFVFVAIMAVGTVYCMKKYLN